MYFLTLTKTSIFVNNANRFPNRPGDVIAVFPRQAFPATRVKRAAVWSSLYVQFPGSDYADSIGFPVGHLLASNEYQISLSHRRR